MKPIDQILRKSIHEFIWSIPRSENLHKINHVGNYFIKTSIYFTNFKSIEVI